MAALRCSELLPANCGHGFGSEIFDALEVSGRAHDVAALTLTVLASNRAAYRFYVRRGFAEIGPADAPHILMRKSRAL